MFVKVRITSGSSAGKELTFRVKQFVIGRADECNLRPQSDTISRRHCVIAISESQASILDLGSRNGTIVNEDRADTPIQLKVGDIVRIGSLKFQILECPQPTSAAKPATVTTKKETKLGGGSGIISDWLLEAETNSRIREATAELETRQYSFEDTDRITIDPPAAEAPPETAPQPTTAMPAKPDPKKKSQPGKLPKIAPPEDAPKNTQEAATQMLKKFWKRS